MRCSTSPRPIYSDDIRVVVLKGKAFSAICRTCGKRIGGVTGASYGERASTPPSGTGNPSSTATSARQSPAQAGTGHLDAALIGNGERGLNGCWPMTLGWPEYRDRFEIRQHR